MADEDAFVDEDAAAEFAPLGAEGEVLAGAVVGGGPEAVHIPKLGVWHELHMRLHLLEDGAMHAHEATGGFGDLPQDTRRLGRIFLAWQRNEGRIEAHGALAVEAEDERLIMLHEVGEILRLEHEIGVDDDHLLAVALQELLRGDVHRITGIRRAEMAEDAFTLQGPHHAHRPGGDREAHAVVDDGIEKGFVV